MPHTCWSHAAVVGQAQGRSHIVATYIKGDDFDLIACVRAVTRSSHLHGQACACNFASTGDNELANCTSVFAARTNDVIPTGL